MFNSSINNKLIQEYLITYILGGTTVYITFTFMHLADAFIQSNLQCIQVIHLYCQHVCSLGIEPTTFVLLMQCSTTEATGCTSQQPDKFLLN